jgi:hypothetical protein
MRRRAAWLLFAGYLPSLLFLGHWDLQIDIPGTAYYVGLPGDTGHSHADHSQHCHADMGSCSDLPLVTAAPVALLAATVETPREDSRGFPAPSAGWHPAGTIDSAPDTPPPRAA